MKYKLISFLAAFCLLAGAFAFAVIDRSSGISRYHQHLEQPGDGDLAPCPRCGGRSQLCTHLPIIRIDTGGQKIPGKRLYDSQHNLIGYETGASGETEILVQVETVQQENVRHHADDPPSITASALFRVRGNSSRAFRKSSYRVKLVQPDNPSQKDPQPLLGMTSGDEWALHGPFLDKTLIRNYICMNLAGEIMADTPDVRFCELILDGEYQGLYLLMETISVQEGRVPLTPYTPGNLPGSYIVSIEPYADPQRTIENFSQYTKRMEFGSRLQIRYPSAANLTSEVKAAINADFSRMERALYSYQMADGSSFYSRFLQVDTFVDYYILNEFLAINDAFSASTYFTKDARGKLRIGPVWDFNNAWDNYLIPYESGDFLLSQRGWYAQLMKSRDFVSRVVSRYQALRKGVLSDAYLENNIRRTIAWLGSAIERNFQIWGYTFDPGQLSMYERRRPLAGDSASTIYDLNPSSHQQAVDWMLDYLRRRGEWLDRNIHTLYQYCQPSRNAPQILH